MAAPISPAGIGADHALFDVEQQQVDDGQRVAAQLLEIGQRLARRAELEAGKAPARIEHGQDHLTIRLGDLVERGGLEARREEELVLRVQGVQVAHQQEEFFFLQLLEVRLHRRPGVGWLGGHGGLTLMLEIVNPVTIRPEHFFRCGLTGRATGWMCFGSQDTLATYGLLPDYAACTRR